jgi:hypothetical protein
VPGSDTYAGGALTSRTQQTEAKSLSLVTQTTVYDCHGTPAFTFQAGGVFDTIVNNSVPHKSIIQTFAPNGTQLAFVPGAAAAVDVDSITLYDMNNAPVATLSRDKSSSSWSWTLTVLQPGSPAGGLARSHRDRGVHLV